MWECSKCGVCCSFAWLMKPEWDRGDGTCKYHKNKLCSIYETRPDICRVKDYSKESELNVACEKIRRVYGK